mmetsp:Transcript_28722/g.54348  ORF Transcript_28722/g.54348 Transcript_28722/m.54348 type:complete len:220 (-) Transcript_28722:4791-5450(-)
MFFSHLDDFLHRANIAVHGVHGLKGNDLGRVGGQSGQLAIQILWVVMLPDDFFGATVPDAFDHRGVIEFVRKDHGVGQAAAKGGKGRPIRHIARCEQQRVLLAMQVGQFGLKQFMRVIGARDIACAASPCAAIVDGVFHGPGHGGMLAHSEIVVRTPDGHLVGGLVIMAACARKCPGLAFQFCKYAVVPLLFQRVELVLEQYIKVHDAPLGWSVVLVLV